MVQVWSPARGSRGWTPPSVGKAWSRATGPPGNSQHRSFKLLKCSEPVFSFVCIVTLYVAFPKVIWPFLCITPANTFNIDNCYFNAVVLRHENFMLQIFFKDSLGPNIVNFLLEQIGIFKTEHLLSPLFPKRRDALFQHLSRWEVHNERWRASLKWSAHPYAPLPYVSYLPVDLMNWLRSSDHHFGASGSGRVDSFSCTLSPEATHAFSCFTELMKRMNQNFPHGAPCGHTLCQHEIR